MRAAIDAAEKAAEDDSGAAAAAAAESVVVQGGKLRDLEVLTIWSDHIDKTSKEAADKKQTTTGSMQCTLVAAMLAAEAAKAAKAEKEKVAAVAAEEAAAAANEAEDQRCQKGQRIQTKSLLAMKRDNRKVVETAEERAERFKKGLESCLW